jgi:hypothetical protein
VGSVHTLVVVLAAAFFGKFTVKDGWFLAVLGVSRGSTLSLARALLSSLSVSSIMTALLPYSSGEPISSGSIWTKNSSVVALLVSDKSGFEFGGVVTGSHVHFWDMCLVNCNTGLVVCSNLCWLLLPRESCYSIMLRRFVELIFDMCCLLDVDFFLIHYYYIYFIASRNMMNW